MGGCETCRGEVWCPICEDRRDRLRAMPSQTCREMVHNASRVSANYGGGGVAYEGVAVGYSEVPQVCLLLDNGEKIWWRQDLCTFAPTTPPKPDEPTGLGAVVEDAEGQKYVLAPECQGDSTPWLRANGRWFKWVDVPAVRVLSEGVQA